MRTLRSPIILLFFFTFLIQEAGAQYFNSLQSNAWKRYRSEMSFQLGATSFLGELGGRDQVGSDFIWDLETSETQPCGSLGWRYYIAKSSSINLSGSFGLVSGDDALTDERFRHNRNLHFRSIIIEAALKYELHFSFKRLGNLYGIGSRSARHKNAYRDLYAFVGFGGFYFNPQAKYKGEWVDLQPLGTEGQGLEGEPEKYDLFQPAIPMGLGFRIGMGRKYRVGIEIGYRKTFTDYIDDVSTDYYDNRKLRLERGKKAAYLADPSLGEIPTYTDGSYTYDPTAEGNQRGDPTDKDTYIFSTITFSWKIGMQTYRKFKWRRKTRAKF